MMIKWFLLVNNKYDNYNQSFGEIKNYKNNKKNIKEITNLLEIKIQEIKFKINNNTINNLDIPNNITNRSME